MKQLLKLFFLKKKGYGIGRLFNKGSDKMFG